jgi:tetratricopeptide (TPR) repeat protein
MKEDDANTRLCYEKAVEVAPKFAAGYGSYARYLVSYANTDFEKAIELSTKAIELDAKEFNFYLDRADAYLQLKQFNKAIADAEYYLEQEDVMIFAGYLMLINCYIEQDDQVKLKELLMSFEVGQIDFMAGPVMASKIGDYYISYNEPERACGAYRVSAENYEILEGELPTELQKKLANCK